MRLVDTEEDGGNYEFFRSKIEEEIRKDEKQCKQYEWEFKKRDPELHTIGDIIRATLAIKEPGEARRFFEGQVAWLMKRFSKSREEAKYIARQNIGWCFGEGMERSLVQMWNETVQASHPAFGNHLPTPEEAFAAGKVMGERLAQRHPKG